MINEEQLGIGEGASGEGVWICVHCGKPADHSYGAQEKDQLLHLLMCPQGKVTLGEWMTLEDKKAELKAFAAKLKGPK